MKKIQNIDKFYVILSAILVALAIFVIICLKGIFGAITTANQVDEALLQQNSPRLDKTKIDQALESIKNREFTPLDLQ